MRILVSTISRANDPPSVLIKNDPSLNDSDTLRNNIIDISINYNNLQPYNLNIITPHRENRIITSIWVRRHNGTAC